MGQSKSPESQVHLQRVMDLALERRDGVMLRCESESQAFSRRMQAYTARKRDRELNKKVYEEDHPRYGKSVWDSLVFIIKGRNLIIQRSEALLKNLPIYDPKTGEKIDPDEDENSNQDEDSII